MANIKRLTILSGKRLKRLFEIINELNPGIIDEKKQKEWNSLTNPDERSIRITAFFSMNYFSDADINKINKHVFKIEIPWRIILCFIFFIILVFAGIKYFQFYQLPRIYAYGNNTPVFSSDSAEVNPISQMDIFGEKFIDNGKMSTSFSSMILLDTSNAYVKVSSDNFIHWLFSKGTVGFVKKGNVIFTEEEYDEYKLIFRSLEGSKDLLGLDDKSRQIIHNVIKKSPSLNSSVVADDYPDSLSKSGYFKIIGNVHVPLNDTAYIFLRLKTTISAKNLVIRFNDVGAIDFKEIVEISDKPITNAGLFKADSTKGSAPDIYFYDKKYKKDRKSILPPYQTFNY